MCFISAGLQNPAIAKLPGQRRQHLNPPAARVDFKAHGGRQHGALAGETRQKFGMVGWIFRHQHNGPDRLRRIGMRLIFCIPEVLRMMVLAGEKPCGGDQRRLRESQRESNFRSRAIGAGGLAAKIEGHEIADAQSRKGCRIGFCVARLQRQHGQSLALSQIAADKAAKRILPRAWMQRHSRPSRPHADQFQKRAAKLDDMVLRAPGMLVAGTDVKTEATISGGLRTEVARRQHEVVERAGPAHTSLDCTTAALMKLANNGCGSNGLDFSSGWYCTPMNHGCSGNSMVSGKMPSGDIPANTMPPASSRAR